MRSAGYTLELIGYPNLMLIVSVGIFLCGLSIVYVYRPQVQWVFSLRPEETRL